MSKDGGIYLKKFINSLDYSLDLIKLREIYYRKYRRKGFSFSIKNKQYSTQVINVTFKYANKEWNRFGRRLYVKFGYDLNTIHMCNGIGVVDGEVVAITVNSPVPRTDCELPVYFEYSDGMYHCIKQPKTIMSRSALRKYLYKHGFNCGGVHYVRMKRSSGSARVGKCLFINEDLYKMMHQWEMCGITIQEGQEVDLAALESYISLPMSSIIDTLEIDPKSILVIDDYESVFRERVIATNVVDGWLHSEEKDVTVMNSIWDGQGLLDVSVFGKYRDKGMLLLRNLFFKCCCFNTNIQQFFKDNNIIAVEQLSGVTLAERIEDIKLIVTPSSIKYVKFGSLIQWLNNIPSCFGIVKYDKPTHFFDGRMVQTHYQLLNTLQLNKKEMEEFLKPSLNFAYMLQTEPSVVKYYIKYPDDKGVEDAPMKDANDIVYNLMNLNERFSETKYYYDFVNNLTASFYKQLKNGHVYVNGNYSTLFGNPMEMLYSAICAFNGKSQIGVGNIHSTRFEYGKPILGSRSPHVTMGNVLVSTNTANEEIDRYFNLTPQIVCVNSIGENLLQRLSGADFDSDTMLLTDDPTLVKAAQKNYDVFKTPTSLVEARKHKRYYTPEQQADLDIKTSVNKIGEIINLSQVLNSLYWDRIHNGLSHDDNHDLYCDIATLDVLSNIEIDKAKKEFEIDSVKELNKIRNKYSEQLTHCMDSGSKKILPFFFSHISRQKGYYDPERKNYVKHHTSMDYLQTIVNSFRIKHPKRKNPQPLVNILNADTYDKRHVNYEQVTAIVDKLRNYMTEVHTIYSGYEDMDVKKALQLNCYDELIDALSKERIGYNTMYYLLSVVETPEYKDIKTKLFTLLFKTNNESFIKALKTSVEPVPYLVQESGVIEIFGSKMSKIYKFGA